MFNIKTMGLSFIFLKNVAIAGIIKRFEIISIIEKLNPPSNGEKPF